MKKWIIGIVVVVIVVLGFMFANRDHHGTANVSVYCTQAQGQTEATCLSINTPSEGQITVTKGESNVVFNTKTDNASGMTDAYAKDAPNKPVFTLKKEGDSYVISGGEYVGTYSMSH